jgi:hypothetical protein
MNMLIQKMPHHHSAHPGSMDIIQSKLDAGQNSEIQLCSQDPSSQPLHSEGSSDCLCRVSSRGHHGHQEERAARKLVHAMVIHVLMLTHVRYYKATVTM